jgi:iron uptake system component EfeO
VQRPTVAVLSLAGMASLLAACSGQQNAAPANTPTIAVDASDNACKLATTTAPAGTVTFNIHNSGSQITEFYLYAPGNQIVSEMENIAPGMTRPMVVQVQGGQYTAACKPGMSGDGIRGAFTVTGSAAAPSGAADQGVDAYKKYVAEQAEQLQQGTAAFADAVKAGRVDDAKRLYPQARVYWERIEPVAETFGDLDDKIDAREGDVKPGEQWTGYHRLEKELWTGGPQPDAAGLAEQLVADVHEIADKAKDADLNAAKTANGAKELLDEVATKKVTGEEEAFSHTDLWDFKANVDGAKQVVDSFRPLLQSKNPDLLAQLDQRFAAVDGLLARYQRGDWFASYTELSPDQVKELGAAVDALGEPLSKTAGVVAGQ